MTQQLNEYFNRGEFKCKCGKCNCDSVDAALLRILTTVREYFNTPVIINSAHRCKKHNDAIGSNDRSQHLLAKAADIEVKGVAPVEVYEFIDRHVPNMYGLGLYVADEFVHVDVRESRARWTQ
jgi:uncharacterized protein YcbK (DUF882 family)